MKILAVTKYPPIQGGVSASAYWLCNTLVQLGHQVSVVTNADEIEGNFRLNINIHDVERLKIDGVHVFNTRTIQQDSYIPWANPYMSKLLGQCLELINVDRPDIIYGSYFEPYGLVAAIAGKINNIPVFIRHAGSDLGRLSYHPQLRESYRWMLKNTILVSPFTTEFAGAFGDISLNRVYMPRSRLPAIFNADAVILDFQKEMETADKWYRSALDDPQLNSWANEHRFREIDDNVVKIGVYGKVADAKGSFDLLHACQQLAEEGVNFNLFCMVSGSRLKLEQFYQFVRSSPFLSQRTWLLPPIAPWRVPNFLASCDIIAFLERGFSVSFHTPMIPREVLAVGPCLICSGEIARKRDYERSWVHRENIFVVDDPRDARYLVGALREVIANPDLRDRIAAQGRYLSKFWERSLPSYRESAEKLISEIETMF